MQDQTKQVDDKYQTDKNKHEETEEVKERGNERRKEKREREELIGGDIKKEGPPKRTVQVLRATHKAGLVMSEPTVKPLLGRYRLRMWFWFPRDASVTLLAPFVKVCFRKKSQNLFLLYVSNFQWQIVYSVHSDTQKAGVEQTHFCCRFQRETNGRSEIQ